MHHAGFQEDETARVEVDFRQYIETAGPYAIVRGETWREKYRISTV